MAARRVLDGVASLSSMVVKFQGGDDTASTPSQSKAQPATKRAALDALEDDDSSSSDEESDSGDENDAPVDPSFFDRLNGNLTASTPTVSQRAGLTPSKRTPRSKDDEVADSDVERDKKKKKDSNKNGIEKTSKSNERITASDDETSEESSDSSESEAGDESPSKKPKTKAREESSSSSSESESDSESGSEDDSEGDSESDTDSEEDTDSKRMAKSLMNGKKAAAAATAKPSASTSTSASDTSSSSDSDESEDEAPPASQKKSTSNSTKSTQKSSKEPQDDSSSESDPEEADESLAMTESRDETRPHGPGFEGKDFVLRAVHGDEDGKDVTEFFNRARMEGKQLWYFTAPATIPINVIEKIEIPMDKARNGDPVLEHDGASYGVNVSDNANATYKVLIPNEKGTRYEAASRNVDQVMQFKRIIQIPGPESAAAASRPLPPSRVPRPQPKGLRARYRPIGIPPGESMGTIGSSSESEQEDTEMTQAPPLASPTNASKKDTKSKKRQRDSNETPKSSQQLHGNAEAVSTPGPETGASAKKSSKRKHADDEDEDPASSQLIGEGRSAEKKKKAKKQKRGQDNEAAPPPSATKLTPVPPPKVPISSKKSAVAPPTEMSPTPGASSRKNKRVSFSADATAAPAAEIPKESPVPIPQIPHAKRSSPSAAESTPKASKEKKTKKKKSKDVGSGPNSSQSSIPPPKETPILPPTVRRMKK